MSEIATVNVNCGPPLSAVSCCPSISKATVSTDPGLPGPTSVYRDVLRTFEFLKTEQIFERDQTGGQT